VGVGDRPVIAIAIAAGGFEVVVAHAVALASPDEGAATENAQALPGKRLVRRGAVGIFGVGDGQLVVVFHARVAVFQNGSGAESFGGVIEVRELESRGVRGEFGGADGAAGFEQRDFEAGFGADLGGPSAGGAGTDDDDVVGLGERILVQEIPEHYLWFPSWS